MNNVEQYLGWLNFSGIMKLARVALAQTKADSKQVTTMSKEAQIIIHAGRQRDGYVFGLRPRSRVWLEERYPQKERVASLFIGLDKMQDIQQLPASILTQVLNLLTGLSLDELNEIGGFAIYDPATKQPLFDSLPIYV